MTNRNTDRQRTDHRAADRVVGVLLLGLSAVLCWQTLAIPTGNSAPGSATATAWLVTGLIALFSIIFLVRGDRLHEPEPVAGEQINRRALGWVGAGLMLNLALIGSAGFVIATSVLFAITARAFGSKRLMRDLMVGLLLACSVYLAFDRLLGYAIGSGLVEQFL